MDGNDRVRGGRGADTLNGDAGDDRISGRGDGSVSGFTGLRLSECAVRSPEPKSVCQRLLALPDLRTGVDIEQPDGLQQRSGSCPQRAFDGGGRHVVLDDQGDILFGDRETRDDRDVASGRRCGNQRIKIDLRCGGARRQTESRTDLWVQLAGVPDPFARGQVGRLAIAELKLANPRVSKDNKAALLETKAMLESEK